MQKIPHIGVLALQGAFIEHENMLMRLGARCHEIRKLTDLGRAGFTWWREHRAKKIITRFRFI